MCDMLSIHQLDELGREQLYMVINRLKRHISCMNSDMMRFELHLNKFKKYFERFNETIGLKDELADLIEDIELLNRLNGKRCKVSIDELALDSEANTEDSIRFNDNLSDDFNFDLNDTNSVTSLTDKSDDFNDDSIDISFRQLESIVESSYIGDRSFGNYNQNCYNSCSRNRYHARQKPKPIHYSRSNQTRTKELAEVLELKKKLHSRDRHCHHSHRETDSTKNKRLNAIRTKTEIQVPSFDVYEYMENDENMDIFDHVKLKNRKKKFICEWQGCNKAYAFQTGLDKHKRSHVTFECEWEECSATFTSKKSFNDHHRAHKRARNRLNSKNYEDLDHNFVADCNDLNDSQPEIDHLVEDYSNVSPNLNEIYQLGDDPVLLCTEPGCDYRTTDNELLNSHYKSHTNLNKCEFCGRGFMSRAQTNKHIQMQHKTAFEISEDPPIRCQWNGCDQLFRTDQEMLSHVRTTHEYQNQYEEEEEEEEALPESPVVQFICSVPECGQTFNSEPLFKDHLRLHARRLVPCIWPECDFKTHSTELIKEHMESHLKR